MSIEEMVNAHLNSVNQAILDLQNQKRAIENEILKLTDYLNQGNVLISEYIAEKSMEK